MPYNIGCAGGWNMIMKSYMNAPYWVIINHDCSFGSGFLKEMYEAAQDEETGLVFGTALGTPVGTAFGTTLGTGCFRCPSDFLSVVW